jgi:hypothetical protein
MKQNVASAGPYVPAIECVELSLKSLRQSSTPSRQHETGWLWREPEHPLVGVAELAIYRMASYRSDAEVEQELQSLWPDCQVHVKSRRLVHTRQSVECRGETRIVRLSRSLLSWLSPIRKAFAGE